MYMCLYSLLWFLEYCEYCGRNNNIHYDHTIMQCKLLRNKTFHIPLAQLLDARGGGGGDKHHDTIVC